MSKKIFDILPPEKVKRAPLFEKEGKKISEKNKTITYFSKKKRNLIFIVLILVLVFLSCYFTLSKAEVEIWPVKRVSTFKTEITISKEINQLDISSKSIPGEIFEIEKTVSEEISSSGKALKENKAEGIIRVYNVYSSKSQILIARTRFVSADGKLFRTPVRVVIPGEHYEDGKLVPGYSDIAVKADQPGPEYNIDASSFSIPGFAGTARYTKFYGESFQNMTGGFKEEVSKVTQEDLDQAQETLEKRALEQNEIALKEKIPSDFILLKGILDSKILDKFSSAQAEDELEKFNFQVKAKSTALVFKTEDIETFAKEYIISQISKEEELYQESLKLNYDLKTIDLETGKISLSLNMEAKIYSAIDQDELKKALRKKSLTETQIFLENLPQITKALVRFSPFWVNRIPENTEKIKLKLNLD